MLNYLVVQDGQVGIGRQWDGGGRPDKVAHVVSVLHFGVAGEAPEDGVDQGLGHVLFHLLNHDGEIRVGVVVVEHVAHGLGAKPGLFI